MGIVSPGEERQNYFASIKKDGKFVQNLAISSKVKFKVQDKDKLEKIVQGIYSSQAEGQKPLSVNIKDVQRDNKNMQEVVTYDVQGKQHELRLNIGFGDVDSSISVDLKTMREVSTQPTKKVKGSFGEHFSDVFNQNFFAFIAGLISGPGVLIPLVYFLGKAIYLTWKETEEDPGLVRMMKGLGQEGIEGQISAFDEAAELFEKTALEGSGKESESKEVFNQMRESRNVAQDVKDCLDGKNTFKAVGEKWESTLTARYIAHMNRAREELRQCKNEDQRKKVIDKYTKTPLLVVPTGYYKGTVYQSMLLTFFMNEKGQLCMEKMTDDKEARENASGKIARIYYTFKEPKKISGLLTSVFILNRSPEKTTGLSKEESDLLSNIKKYLLQEEEVEEAAEAQVEKPSTISTDFDKLIIHNGGVFYDEAAKESDKVDPFASLNSWWQKGVEVFSLSRKIRELHDKLETKLEKLKNLVHEDIIKSEIAELERLIETKRRELDDDELLKKREILKNLQEKQSDVNYQYTIEILQKDIVKLEANREARNEAKFEAIGFEIGVLQDQLNKKLEELKGLKSQEKISAEDFQKEIKDLQSEITKLEMSGAMGTIGNLLVSKIGDFATAVFESSETIPSPEPEEVTTPPEIEAPSKEKEAVVEQETLGDHAANKLRELATYLKHFGEDLKKLGEQEQKRSVQLSQEPPEFLRSFYDKINSFNVGFGKKIDKLREEGFLISKHKVQLHTTKEIESERKVEDQKKVAATVTPSPSLQAQHLSVSEPAGPAPVTPIIRSHSVAILPSPQPLASPKPVQTPTASVVQEKTVAAETEQKQVATTKETPKEKVIAESTSDKVWNAVFSPFRNLRKDIKGFIVKDVIEPAKGLRLREKADQMAESFKEKVSESISTISKELNKVTTDIFKKSYDLVIKGMEVNLAAQVKALAEDYRQLKLAYAGKYSPEFAFVERKIGNLIKNLDDLKLSEGPKNLDKKLKKIENDLIEIQNILYPLEETLSLKQFENDRQKLLDLTNKRNKLNENFLNTQQAFINLIGGCQETLANIASERAKKEKEVMGKEQPQEPAPPLQPKPVGPLSRLPFSLAVGDQAEAAKPHPKPPVATPAPHLPIPAESDVKKEEAGGEVSVTVTVAKPAPIAGRQEPDLKQDALAPKPAPQPTTVTATREQDLKAVPPPPAALPELDLKHAQAEQVKPAPELAKPVKLRTKSPGDAIWDMLGPWRRAALSEVPSSDKLMLEMSVTIHHMETTLKNVDRLSPTDQARLLKYQRERIANLKNKVNVAFADDEAYSTLIKENVWFKNLDEKIQELEARIASFDDKLLIGAGNNLRRDMNRPAVTDLSVTLASRAPTPVITPAQPVKLEDVGPAAQAKAKEADQKEKKVGDITVYLKEKIPAFEKLCATLNTKEKPDPARLNEALAQFETLKDVAKSLCKQGRYEEAALVSERIIKALPVPKPDIFKDYGVFQKKWGELLGGLKNGMWDHFEVEGIEELNQWSAGITQVTQVMWESKLRLGESRISLDSRLELFAGQAIITKIGHCKSELIKKKNNWGAKLLEAWKRKSFIDQFMKISESDLNKVKGIPNDRRIAIFSQMYQLKQQLRKEIESRPDFKEKLQKHFGSEDKLLSYAHKEAFIDKLMIDFLNNSLDSDTVYRELMNQLLTKDIIKEEVQAEYGFKDNTPKEIVQWATESYLEEKIFKGKKTFKDEFVRRAENLGEFCRKYKINANDGRDILFGSCTNDYYQIFKEMTAGKFIADEPNSRFQELNHFFVMEKDNSNIVRLDTFKNYDDTYLKAQLAFDQVSSSEANIQEYRLIYQSKLRDIRQGPYRPLPSSITDLRRHTVMMQCLLTPESCLFISHPDPKKGEAAHKEIQAKAEVQKEARKKEVAALEEELVQDEEELKTLTDKTKKAEKIEHLKNLRKKIKQFKEEIDQNLFLRDLYRAQVTERLKQMKGLDLTVGGFEGDFTKPQIRVVAEGGDQNSPGLDYRPYGDVHGNPAIVDLSQTQTEAGRVPESLMSTAIATDTSPLEGEAGIIGLWKTEFPSKTIAEKGRDFGYAHMTESRAMAEAAEGEYGIVDGFLLNSLNIALGKTDQGLESPNSVAISGSYKIAFAPTTAMEPFDLICNRTDLLNDENFQRVISLALFQPLLFKKLIQDNPELFLKRMEIFKLKISEALEKKQFKTAAFLMCVGNRIRQHVAQISKEQSQVTQADKKEGLALLGEPKPSALDVKERAAAEQERKENPYDLLQSFPSYSTDYGTPQNPKIGYQYLASAQKDPKENQRFIATYLLDWFRTECPDEERRKIFSPAGDPRADALIHAYTRIKKSSEEPAILSLETRATKWFDLEFIPTLPEGTQKDVRVRLEQSSDKPEPIPEKIRKTPEFFALFGNVEINAKATRLGENHFRYEFDLPNGQKFQVLYKNENIEIHQKMSPEITRGNEEWYRFNPLRGKKLTNANLLIQKNGAWVNEAQTHGIVMLKGPVTSKKEDLLEVTIKNGSVTHAKTLGTKENPSAEVCQDDGTLSQWLSFISPNALLFLRQVGSKTGPTEIRILSHGITLKKQGGEWVIVEGKGKGSIWITDFSSRAIANEGLQKTSQDLVKALGLMMGECMLSLKNPKNKEERFIIFPNLVDVDKAGNITFNKSTYGHESDLQLEITVNARGELSTSSTGYLYLAYLCQAKAQSLQTNNDARSIAYYKRALRYLQLAKNAYLNPAEKTLFNAISKELTKVQPTKSVEHMAFQLKAELAISHIQRQQLGQKATDRSQESQIHIIDLHAKYREEVERYQSRGLALDDDLLLKTDEEEEFQMVQTETVRSTLKLILQQSDSLQTGRVTAPKAMGFNLTEFDMPKDFVLHLGVTMADPSDKAPPLAELTHVNSNNVLKFFTRYSIQILSGEMKFPDDFQNLLIAQNNEKDPELASSVEYARKALFLIAQFRPGASIGLQYSISQRKAEIETSEESKIPLQQLAHGIEKGSYDFIMKDGKFIDRKEIVDMRFALENKNKELPSVTNEVKLNLIKNYLDVLDMLILNEPRNGLNSDQMNRGLSPREITSRVNKIISKKDENIKILRTELERSEKLVRQDAKSKGQLPLSKQALEAEYQNAFSKRGHLIKGLGGVASLYSHGFISKEGEKRGILEGLIVRALGMAMGSEVTPDTKLDSILKNLSDQIKLLSQLQKGQVSEITGKAKIIAPQGTFLFPGATPQQYAQADARTDEVRIEAMSDLAALKKVVESNDDKLSLDEKNAIKDALGKMEEAFNKGPEKGNYDLFLSMKMTLSDLNKVIQEKLKVNLQETRRLEGLKYRIKSLEEQLKQQAAVEKATDAAAEAKEKSAEAPNVNKCNRLSEKYAVVHLPNVAKKTAEVSEHLLSSFSDAAQAEAKAAAAGPDATVAQLSGVLKATATSELEKKENVALIAGLEEASGQMKAQEQSAKTIETKAIPDLIAKIQKRESDLGKLCKVSRQMILDWAKSKDAPPVLSKMSREIEIYGEQAILEEAIDLYQKGKLKKGEDENKEICSELTSFLLNSTELQQLEKSREKLSTLLKESETLSRENYQSIANTIYNEIQSACQQDRYLDEDDHILETQMITRKLLVTEYRGGVILRKEQIDIITQIIKEPNTLALLRMGLGKTSFIMPIILQVFAELGMFPVGVVTQELATMNKASLDQSTRSFYKQAGTEFTFTPDDLNYGEAHLADKYFRLLKVKSEGNYGIMTIESKIAIENALTRLQDKIDQCLQKAGDIQEIKALQKQQYWLIKMRDLFKSDHSLGFRTQLFADEGDEILDSRKEVNQALNQRPPDEHIVGAVKDLMSLIMKETKISQAEEKGAAADPAIALLKKAILSKKQASMLPEDREKAMKALAKKVFNTLLSAETRKQLGCTEEEFVTYMTTPPEGKLAKSPRNVEIEKAVKALEDPKIIKKISALKKHLSSKLSLNLKQNPQIDMGTRKLDGCVIVPKDNKRELPNTQYGDEDDLILCHAIYYIAEAPSEEYLKTVLNRLPDLVPPTLYLNITNAARDKGVEVLDYLKTEEAWEHRLEILYRFVIPERLRLSKEQITFNVHHAIDGCNCGVASGTMNIASMPGSLIPNPDQNPRVIEAETFLKVAQGGKDPVIVNDNDVFDQMSDAISENPRLRSIVNAGVNIKDWSTLEIIRNLRSKHPDRHFIFKTDVQYIWRAGETKPVPFEKADTEKVKAEPGKYLFYFDPADTRGTDFQIPEGDNILISGPTTKMAAYAQAAWRLRQLGVMQKVIPWVISSVAGRISKQQGVAQEKITQSHIVNDVKLKTLEEKAMLNLKTCLLKIRGFAFTGMRDIIYSNRPEYQDDRFWDTSTKERETKLRADIEIRNALFKASRSIMIRSKMPDFESELSPTENVPTVGKGGKIETSYDDAIKNLENIRDEIGKSEKELSAKYPGLCDKRFQEAKDKIQTLLQGLLEAKEQSIKDAEKLKEVLPETTTNKSSGDDGTFEQAQEEQQQQQQQQQQVQQATVRRRGGFALGSDVNEGDYLHPKFDFLYKIKSDEVEKVQTSGLKPGWGLAPPGKQKPAAQPVAKAQETTHIQPVSQAFNISQLNNSGVYATNSASENLNSIPNAIGEPLARLMIIVPKDPTMPPTVTLIGKNDFHVAYRSLGEEEQKAADFAVYSFEGTQKDHNNLMFDSEKGKPIDMSNEQILVKCALARIVMGYGNFSPEEEKALKKYFTTAPFDFNQFIKEIEVRSPHLVPVLEKIYKS